MDYPKWVSRGFGMGEILCANADEEAAVNAEREARENPDADPAEADGQGHTVASVRAALDAAGIAYDKRLGLAKLLALLPKE